MLQHISSLGDVILVSHVIVQAENSEKKERLFVLFHGALVMLSTSAQLNTYTYEVRALDATRTLIEYIVPHASSVTSQRS